MNVVLLPRGNKENHNLLENPKIFRLNPNIQTNFAGKQVCICSRTSISNPAVRNKVWNLFFHPLIFLLAVPLNNVAP